MLLRLFKCDVDELSCVRGEIGVKERILIYLSDSERKKGSQKITNTPLPTSMIVVPDITIVYIKSLQSYIYGEPTFFRGMTR